MLASFNSDVNLLSGRADPNDLSYGLLSTFIRIVIYIGQTLMEI
jgi:hypothetical protein